MIKWQLNPRRVLMALLGIAIGLAVTSLAAEYAVEVLLAPESGTIRVDVLDLFSVNTEESIPTWYSTIQLFVVAVIFAVIAVAKYRADDSYRHYWAGLVVLFAYLSMDEGAVIHEIVADPLHRTFDTTGFLAFGWQIAAIPIVMILGLIYLRFFWQLRTKTRNLLLISAGIYAGGALLIEGISAAIYDANGLTMTYLTVATLEEFAEIIGVSLVVYTLLEYMEWATIGFTLSAEEINVSGKRSSQVNGSVVWVIVVSVLITVASLVAISWQWGDVIPQDEVVEVILPFYHPLQDDLNATQTITFELPEVFSVNSDLTREIAYDLLAHHTQVTIVALPSEGRSVFFAGDALPFDTDALTALLHENGFIEFVIYETDVVRVFTMGLRRE